MMWCADWMLGAARLVRGCGLLGLGFLSVAGGVSPKGAWAAEATPSIGQVVRSDADFTLLLTRVREDQAPWSLKIRASWQADPTLEHPVMLRIDRPGPEDYRIQVEAAGHQVILERTRTETRLRVPQHQVVFWGRSEGEASGTSSLAPRDLPARLISRHSSAWPIFRTLQNLDPALAQAALPMLGVQFEKESEKRVWTLKSSRAHVQLHYLDPEPIFLRDPPAPGAGEQRVEVSRAELERLIARAVHRGGEVLWPIRALDAPAAVERSVPHGQLTWKQGQRVVHLWGTPRQMGQAHGQLLAEEARRCVDSTLHLVGLAHAIRQGKWLPDELRGAWQRLRPHIPQSHLEELEALAEAAGIDQQMMELTQVFPELFHCSGFAVMASATADGRLYHGRVLDYMTHIGLQHVSTVFVMQPADHLAFVNVGYAGFTGSVTGMNEAQISLGEMGGAGLGDWDGVPMATLMRRALEECRTLEEVQKLWTESPRTCEYFYVWADGKTRQAVGVAATAETIEFIQPGQPHPMLGESLPDALLLSRGKRLEALCERVEQQHGRIDVLSAQKLMARPVAMKSNLHNVLFVPEDLQLFVAHADSRHRAYDRPYVQLSLPELLGRSQGK